MDFGRSYFNELSYILQGINEHVYFQTTFFLATVFGITPNSFKDQAAEKLDRGRINDKKLLDV